MEYMTGACHLQKEAEIKLIKGKSFTKNLFISKSIELKGFTWRGHSLFNTDIHTYINKQTPVRIPCNNKYYNDISTPHGERL